MQRGQQPGVPVWARGRPQRALLLILKLSCMAWADKEMPGEQQVPHTAKECSKEPLALLRVLGDRSPLAVRDLNILWFSSPGHPRGSNHRG